MKVTNEEFDATMSTFNTADKKYRRKVGNFFKLETKSLIWGF